MWVYLLMLSAAVGVAHGHGRILEPAGRGTAWRVGFNARANYDDDGLNCGGFHHQHSVNGGKCGVCGDPYDSAQPRAHERGGIYDSGVIVASYQQGSVITITIQITAHHRGYWEFKLCPDSYEPDQDCFDSYPLELETGGTRYYPKQGSTKYYVNYRLPAGLTCDNCVLQWKYICGNNWGKCEDGTEGLGCGLQENFGACSDISIEGSPEIPSFIQLNSLMLDKVKEQDLVRLLLNAAMLPQRWVQTNIQSQPQKQRLNSKKPHTKGINFIEHFTHASKPHTKSKQENHKPKSKHKKKNKRKKKIAPSNVKWMASWR